MTRMSDLLRRAGVTSSTVADTQPSPVVATSAPGTDRAPVGDPPEEYLLRYAAACVLLGRALTPPLTPEALADRLADCQDNTNRGRSAWQDGLIRRLGLLTGRQANAVEEVADLRVSLTSRGVPTWSGLAAEVERALTEGHAEAWITARAEVDQAVGVAVIPPREVDEEWSAYRGRLDEWALDQQVAVLRRLFPPSYTGGPPDIAGYVTQLERNAREAAEAALAVRVDREIQTAQVEILRRLDDGIPAADIARQVAWDRQPDGEYYRPLCRELGLSAITGVSSGPVARQLDDFLTTTPQGWDAALPYDGTPPQGWETLTPSPLRLYAAGRKDDGVTRVAAGEEALRRWGAGAVYCVDERTYVVTPHGVARVVQAERAALPSADRVSLTPTPAGWCELVSAGGSRELPTVRWCGREVAGALVRLQAAAERPGGLDVRRAIVAGLYGRHETKQFPRFHEGGIMVGIEDRLGGILDDLFAVWSMAPDRMPKAAWRIHAAVRKTAAGGLRMVAGEQTGGLLVVESRDELGPRRGTPRGDDRPRADSPALAATSTRSWRAHHQHLNATTTLAVVEHGRPLLMESGIGYRYAEGRVWRVPGLATGRPGTPEPV